MMVVLITNVTDAPGKNPINVDIYNKTLSPGTSIKIPMDLVTKKLRALEDRGFIAIGNLPPWYVTAKRHSKPLSEEQRKKRQIVRPPKAEKPEKTDKKEREPVTKKE